MNIDDVEQVRTRWRNRDTPERAEVLIPGHGSGDSLVFVQVKGGNNEILPRTFRTGTGRSYPIENGVFQGFFLRTEARSGPQVVEIFNVFPNVVA